MRTPAQARRRRRTIVFLVAFVTLPLVLFGILPFSLTVYDRAHLVWVECEVEIAQFGSGSARGAGGYGTSTPEVRIFTEECGAPITLRSGVTGDNGAEVAESFQAGETYRFQIGETDWARRDWPFQAMTAYGYEETDR